MSKTKQPKVLPLTEQGKENLEKEIVMLELKYRAVQAEIGAYCRENPIREDNVDSVLSALREKAKNVLRETRRKTQLLSIVKIIDEVECLDTVQLGKFIKLNLTYDGPQGIEKELDYIVELTGNVEADYGLEFDQISQKCPLGENILNKKVGDVVRFEIPNSQLECEAEILEIVKGLKNSPKVFVK